MAGICGKVVAPATVQPSTSLAKLVECPVCFKLPIPPIYGCVNGHIICETCKDKVEQCSVCRADKFNVRNFIVEEILNGPNLQCIYCEAPGFTGLEYPKHVLHCPSRPVECNCKIGTLCVSKMVPKEEYVAHMKKFHCLAKPKTESFVTDCHMHAGFTPQEFTAFNHRFMLLSHRQQTQFCTWVASVDEEVPTIHLKIGLYYAQIQTNPETNEQAIHTVTIDSDESFPPSKLEAIPQQVLKSGHCLEVFADHAEYNLPPFVWPGYQHQRGEQELLPWGYEITMWKPNVAEKKRKKIAGDPAAVENVPYAEDSDDEDYN